MLLEDKKGIDIKAINVEEITPITSYIVIVTANSTVHAKSMASHILGFFKSTKLTKMIKNQPDSNNPWVLIDAGDILINIFQKEKEIFIILINFTLKVKSNNSLF
jgi:ribosome-associated protein